MYICPLLPIISVLVAKNKIDVHVLLFHIEKKKKKKEVLDGVSGSFDRESNPEDLSPIQIAYH